MYLRGEEEGVPPPLGAEEPSTPEGLALEKRMRGEGEEILPLLGAGESSTPEGPKEK